MKSSRSKLVTFLLAILYFFTGGVFLIGVIIDLILLILGQYTDVEGKII